MPSRPRTRTHARTHKHARVHAEAPVFGAHPPTIPLGVLDDGRALSFCEPFYEFTLDGEPISLEEVRCLDRAGHVYWRHLEQRDWIRSLDETVFDEAYERMLEARGPRAGESVLDAQIRQHVRKDNSYLHGHIVDTNAEQENAAARASSPANDKASDASQPEERAAVNHAGGRTLRRRQARPSDQNRPGFLARFKNKPPYKKGTNQS